MRGRAYHRAGKVLRLTPHEGELARAEVQGKNRTYTVTLRGGDDAARAQCTCSDFAAGSFCKHIWAVLLSVDEQAGTGGAEGHPAAATEHTGIAPPKARKRTQERVDLPSNEPRWLGMLSRLRVVAPGAATNVHAVRVPWEVCYFINGPISEERGAVFVELGRRRRGRQDWRGLSPLRVNAANLIELDDPIDREMCSYLLGAEPLEDESQPSNRWRDRLRDSFMLPTSALGGFLKRVTETGRCYLKKGSAYSVGGTPEPLAWGGDDPWVLWMAGEFEEQDLMVRVELRRAEESIGVEKPDLVMGGPDGVFIHDGQVFRCDDRGGSRWLGWWRDNAWPVEEARSLRVPRADVSRFVDRLFRIHDLPELDLPAVARPTISKTELIPRLDLLGPVGGAAAGTPVVGSHSPGSPRNEAPRWLSDRLKGRLSARVWFEYGPYRVEPGRRGRFIIDQSHDGHTAQPQSDEQVNTAVAELAAQGTASPGAVEQSRFNDAASPQSPVELAGSGSSGADAASLALIPRDTTLEQEHLSFLGEIGFDAEPEQGEGNLVLKAKTLPQVASQLIERGWVVTADQHELVEPPLDVSLSVTSGVDWFELRGGMKFQTASGQTDVGLPEILAAAKAGRSTIQLDDGSLGLLPWQWLEENGMLIGLGRAEGDALRFRSSQAILLDALLSRHPSVDVDKQFREVRDRLHEFETVRAVNPAETFHGELRPYQTEGLGWLRFLTWLGVGGVLADDMGLGKTVQVLAFLDAHYGSIKKEGADHRPSLIVVPRSVLHNWVEEAKRFAPDLRVGAYSGSERAQILDQLSELDVIVTSYGLMRRDVQNLITCQYEYLALDEAQVIKNPGSQAAKAARLLEARHRLALTGTPVENHLGDLWSIFEFLNPGMLGSHAHFAKLIRGALAGRRPKALEMRADHAPETESAEPGPTGPVLKQGGTQIAAALRPFILRRTKKQVLKELPEKNEQTLVCEMGPRQRQTYDELLQHYRSLLTDRGVLGRAAPGSGAMPSQSAMVVLEALLRLRQAACHPGLIDPARADEPSAKLVALMESLDDLVEEGHKALVFSQFTSMLSLVRKRLDERGMVYEYLDGQTRNRQQRVERFQNDPDCPVFLISLKAGGLGLNLTAAEYVFILDPWWNPAVEAQAIDRAHRIGQTRRVFAYRLICQDTVEERIAELQARKKELAEAIVGGQDQPLKSLTRDELERLLS